MIRECSNEALEALDLAPVDEDGETAHPEEGAARSPGSYLYPAEIEERLVNLVGGGDHDGAGTILDRVYSANQAAAGEAGVPKLLFYDLAASLLKAAAGAWRPAPSFGRVLLARLESCSGGAEMHSVLKAATRKLCEAARAAWSRSNSRLYQEIAAFIEDNYEDKMLSLTTIADRFSMSAKYLSAFFKHHSGRNLSDHVARLRLAQAKQLLDTSRLTVSQIARTLGYANEVGFIRMFKRYEGITPGAYRDGRLNPGGLAGKASATP
jgi:AraC-like DNA-binding protein